MTKPDEALLWAREQAGPAYRRGCLDYLLVEEVEGYRAGAAASAERIKELEAKVAELEAALVKANEPRWFYSDEEGSPCHSLDEAIEGFCYYLEPGRHFVEVETARPCPTIWAVVHILTDDEITAREDDEPWVYTLCATEAEARAVLKEDDQ